MITVFIKVKYLLIKQGANATNITTQIKKFKKRPHSFNHNCNHYSLSEGERQQKKKKKIKQGALCG